MLLESERARVEVDLERGGRIASLVVDGDELLVSRDHPEAFEPFGWGSFVMAPYAGRVRDARFTFGGVEHRLVPTDPPHAIHGTVVHRAWEPSGPGRLRCDLGPDWPWDGAVEQELRLDDDGLELRLVVRGAGPMPVSAGWHPWFLRELPGGRRAEVVAEPVAAFELVGPGLPSDRVVPAPPPPWDTPFTGMRRSPVVRWDQGPTVSLASSCDRWFVYDQLPHALCVEPQTARPDALEDETERAVVTAEAPLEAWMRLDWGAS
jgi:aldose 1-epimerase